MTDVIITQAPQSSVIVTETVNSLVSVKDIGPQGLSAYQVAVSNGFIGTEQQWIDSLTGNQSDIVITKAQNELANVVINFTNRLSQGDYITGVESVFSSPNGLTITDISFSSSTVSFKASSGTLLQGYKIDLLVTTFLNGSIPASIFLLNI